MALAGSWSAVGGAHIQAFTFLIDEDTLKITVGCLVCACGVCGVWVVCVHVVLCVWCWWCVYMWCCVWCWLFCGLCVYMWCCVCGVW